jgi:hypothetical protein
MSAAERRALNENVFREMNERLERTARNSAAAWSSFSASAPIPPARPPPPRSVLDARDPDPSSQGESVRPIH